MKAEKRIHIFMFFFAGILVSIMVVMMRLGGSVNFEEFMSAGRVYDFSTLNLQKDSATWRYDSEKEGYWLLSDKALNRFKLDGNEEAWEFLYITVDKLSVESLEGTVKYYAKDGRKSAEQPISLKKGINLILLDENVPMKKMGISFLEAEGEFISISAMQIRTTPSWFTVPHFWELFASAYIGYLIVVAVLVLILRKYHILLKPGHGVGIYALIDVMQYGIQLVGNFLGKKLGGRLSERQRGEVRKLLFSLLFVWMLVGNVTNWLNNAEICRYHILVCVILLLLISFVSWENPLGKMSWKSPIMVSWIWIWLGMIFSDFFVERQLAADKGYGMLLAGTVFIFFWQNMENADKMIWDMLEALELTFFIGTVYCMVFRMKRPAIDYNGLFKSSEEFAMYAVLMVGVFMVEMDRLVSRSICFKGRGKKNSETRDHLFSYIRNITGGAIAFYFLLRSNYTSGIIAVIVISIPFVFRQLRKFLTFPKNIRKIWWKLGIGTMIAFVCAVTVHVSTKYLPHFLKLDIEYEKELLLTELEGEDKELFELQNPGSLTGVRQKQGLEKSLIWRNYARRLNLFGNSEEVYVSRRKTPAYSGYLDMAYRYGIFILIPYLSYQLYLLSAGVYWAFGRKQVGDVAGIWLLFTGVIYLCFSVCSNVEIPWGHPLWLCFYLAVGYPERKERNAS